MAAGKNGSQPKKMDPELFQMLDEGLREIFRRNVEQSAKHDAWNDYPHSMAAAKAGSALIELHRDFEPGN